MDLGGTDQVTRGHLFLQAFEMLIYQALQPF
jgi:hypothetical protein